MSDKKNFPQCYLCKSDTSYLLSKNGYDVVRCGGCGLDQTVFLEPYEKFLKRFYNKGYFTGDPKCAAFTDYGNDKAMIMKNMASYFRIISRYAQGKTLLDVGCAYGFSLLTARAFGFDGWGIEPSSFAASNADPSLAGRIHVTTAKRAKFGSKKFSVITMFDVIEHLHDPISDLLHLRKFLDNDGILVLATGNTDSRAARMMGDRWTFYIPPQHLLFFNKKTIAGMLEKAGFRVEAFSGIGKWVSLGYVLHLAHTDSHIPLTGWLFSLVKFLGIENIPLYIPLGDNMVVVAKKK